jgi:uncharacterized metal-binding protein YceD (DUF177 family)
MTAEEGTMPKGSGDEGVSARGWNVPLAISEVSEAGRHIDLVAGAQARVAVAKLAGLAALPRLEASFDVTRRGRSGLHVGGRVSATVVQTCVVTLEPLENEVDEEIDVAFVPAAAPAVEDYNSGEVEVPLEDALEPLVGNTVDLAAIATEFLILGLDPYPRKPDAVFEAPSVGDESAHPFAALAEFKKGQDGKQR